VPTVNENAWRRGLRAVVRSFSFSDYDRLELAELLHRSLDDENGFLIELPAV
jgi:hypothetical protein